MQGVCVAFNSTTLAPDPVWTRLDDPAGPFIVQSWSISRGRSYELDKTGGGTATVRLVDLHGDFDPTNAGSVFAGKLDPLKQAAIALQNPVTGAWNTLFRGFVDDWVWDMDVSEKFLTLDLSLVDAFDILAAVEVIPDNAGDVVPTESVGDVFYEDGQVDDRIRAGLADAGWPSGLSVVFSGNVAVQETVYPPRTQILSVLQDAADAEFPGVANLYVSRDGKVTFHGRLARFNPTDPQYHINSWACGDTVAVTGDASIAPISSLGFSRGKATLINAAIATPQNIADADIAGQFVSDAASVATYGPRTISFENLLTLTGNTGSTTKEVETKKYAAYYKNNYADPRTRVNQIRFRPTDPAGASGSALWAVMCGVELGDVLHLTTTHPGGGGFDEDFFVEGLHYTAQPMTPAFPEVTLDVDVSPAAYYAIAFS